MYNPDVSRQYKEQSIFTMSPEELTLLLYNGLVKFLMKAETALTQGEFIQANTFLVRSQEIITEFIATLDRQYDIAESLALMYDYMLNQLVQANLKKEAALVVEVSGYAKELRDTWQEAIKIARKASAVSQAASL